MSSFNQSDIPLIYKVCQCKSLMLVLFGNGYDKAQVCRDKLVFGFLAFRTTFLDLLCELNFFVDRD